MNGKFRIVWSNQGGEMDSVVVKGDEYEGAITKALVKMLDGAIVMPGDTFSIEAVL